MLIKARIDTVMTTIDAYVESLKYDVIDGTYYFEDADQTIFAVPIECIEMENEGKYPYGEWLQASNDYWAYVLVQYDPSNQKYTYGFTYKDSVGLGLYPTEEDYFSDQQTVISKGLKLYKPITGSFGNIAGSKDWAGFDLKNDTKLIVLEATEEGGIGNGVTTCTLVRRGSNYEQVQQEKSEKRNREKPCEFVSGDGSTPGDILACGSERFYLLKEDAATMTLLAEHQIEVTLDKPKQNINAEGTFFITDDVPSAYYWVSSAMSNKPSQYFGGVYPTYVYGNYGGNNVYQYVKAYEDHLETDFGVKSAGLTIMSLPQTVSLLKCSYMTSAPTSSVDCNYSPFESWINQGYYWLTGTVSGRNRLAVMDSSYSRFQWGMPQPSPFPLGIRPMLIIDKEEIKDVS